MSVPGTSLKLSTGSAIPVLGFGTWQMHGTEAYDATMRALEAGYRHIDTAALYQNEAEIGRALRNGGMPRNEVFVTTKVPPGEPARQTLAKSLDALGLDHVDLWLIHSPGENATLVPLWKQLVELADEGLTTDIGVSNYSLEQIDLVSAASGRTPAVNQIKWSPALYDPDIEQGHRQRGVVLEGYSPLNASDLNDPALLEVAATHGVTAAQVVLRWHIEHQVVVIPKSTDPERIKQNFEVFSFALSTAQVEKIDALSKSGR